MAGSRCGSPMSGGAVAGMGMVRHHGAGSGGRRVLNHFLRHVEHGAADDRLKEVKERHLKVNINDSFSNDIFLSLFSWRLKDQVCPSMEPSGFGDMNFVVMCVYIALHYYRMWGCKWIVVVVQYILPGQ